MTLEEKFEALMKNYEAMRLQNEEIKNQNEYLRRQLGESMKQRRKELRSSRSFNSSKSDQGEDNHDESHHLNSSSEEDPCRRPRRNRRNTSNFGDIKVEVPEFEARLNPDEFLEWLQTVKRIFDYKEILEEKKVKLVALRSVSMLPLVVQLVCQKSETGEGEDSDLGKDEDQAQGLFLATLLSSR